MVSLSLAVPTPCTVHAHVSPSWELMCLQRGMKSLSSLLGFIMGVGLSQKGEGIWVRGCLGLDGESGEEGTRGAHLVHGVGPGTLCVKLAQTPGSEEVAEGGTCLGGNGQPLDMVSENSGAAAG